ncbi:GfV-C17-ORF1 [Aphelenchoides avenae]|nr:GfV-C17-ORF1 [Aphelenchus avenae]
MADFEVAPASVMKDLFPGVRVVHCQFHLAQNLLKHIMEAGLIDIYRNEEIRPLLRSLWALAFLPPVEVVDGYEALVGALNVLNNRQVIPLDRVAALQSFLYDYFELNYIRRRNPRGVLVAPLFPPHSWNVNGAVVEDGARTNNSQEGWNRGFNARFQRSTGKLSKFLLRLQEDEEQTRQLLDRLHVSPADPARGRRRHKTVIRDSQIRTMVVEYNALAAIDRTPEAKLEFLRRIQNHLSA